MRYVLPYCLYLSILSYAPHDQVEELSLSRKVVVRAVQVARQGDVMPTKLRVFRPLLAAKHPPFRFEIEAVVSKTCNRRGLSLSTFPSSSYLIHMYGWSSSQEVDGQGKEVSTTPLLSGTNVIRERPATFIVEKAFPTDRLRIKGGACPPLSIIVYGNLVDQHDVPLWTMPCLPETPHGQISWLQDIGVQDRHINDTDGW